MNYSSEKIVDAIRNGDPMGEVDVLYQFEYPKIKTYILKNNGSEADAMDVF